eukprot:CAMPEP_0117424430 /NCGR_PEP_ID=MMETSP0758-20121206/4848_1 /TAXON_ID=63605 /ORGANISM="Percolomonas cosmopolitus, Strain AE-1 (ATCC 50343)" /LENGTH=243 /DNA_ID=CAMNT_0005208199 /DNA_START=174 /DNA_END=902 /DNA_ORIENTATION=-
MRQLQAFQEHFDSMKSNDDALDINVKLIFTDQEKELNQYQIKKRKEQKLEMARRRAKLRSTSPLIGRRSRSRSNSRLSSNPITATPSEGPFSETESVSSDFSGIESYAAPSFILGLMRRLERRLFIYASISAHMPRSKIASFLLEFLYSLNKQPLTVRLPSTMTYAYTVVHDYHKIIYSEFLEIYVELLTKKLNDRLQNMCSFPFMQWTKNIDHYDVKKKNTEIEIARLKLLEYDPDNPSEGN